MGYTFQCDGCAGEFGHTPPFMGEFRESFLKTAASPLVDLYEPGQTITMCRDCSEEVFL